MEGRKNANPKEGVHLGLSVFGRRKEKDKAKERPRKNKPYETAFDESFLIKKQKEFRKTFGFAEDEEIVASTYMTPCHFNICSHSGFKVSAVQCKEGAGCKIWSRVHSLLQAAMFVFIQTGGPMKGRFVALAFSSFSI